VSGYQRCPVSVSEAELAALAFDGRALVRTPI
jgi:hypothetical protein